MLKGLPRMQLALLQAAKPSLKTPRLGEQLVVRSAHLDKPHLTHEKSRLAKLKSDEPDVKRRSASVKHANNGPAKRRNSAEKKSDVFVVPHAKNAEPARNKPHAKPQQPKKRKPPNGASAVANAKKKWPLKPNAAVLASTSPQSTATHRRSSQTVVVGPAQTQTTRLAAADQRLDLRRSRGGHR
jgi:hypothetical protein